MRNYLYDENHVRYHLYQVNGDEPYNWLFFPGGPGGDSSYLLSLVDLLDLPGNVWLIDLPGNGSNRREVNFDRWFDYFPDVVKRFENVILVGHSFGGMFPLLFPELEGMLKGFVILNSAPSLWLEESVRYSKQFNLPDLSAEMAAFTKDPNQETFDAALEACIPYYFPPETLEKGRALFSQIGFEYPLAVWWQRKAAELNFNAKWVPEMVPTLIVGGKYDCICPHKLFQKDARFNRPNIEHVVFEKGGHVPWIEDPQGVKEVFEGFISRMNPSKFAVIYRGFIKPEKEAEYVEHWKIVANHFKCERGALGSTLHKTEEGMWVAYSKWPSQEMRDASWPSSEDLPLHVQQAIERLKSCLDEEKELPEIPMSIVKEMK